MDGDKPKIVRFYRDELIKIADPNDDLDRQLIQGVQMGDVVWIACPRTAEIEQRLCNGTWGIVEESGLTLTVIIKGKPMTFLRSDVELIENNPEQLKAIGEKIHLLFAREDLDELDRQVLEFFVTRVDYSDRQLELLEQIWRNYHS